MITTALYIALCILTGLAIFQILLIAGKPLGEYAWGGQNKVLPRKLRVASISSLFIYAGFAVLIASKAGLLPGGESAFVQVTMWVATGYFFLGIFVNAISRSKKERFLMTPVAAALALCFLIVSLT